MTDQSYAAQRVEHLQNRLELVKDDERYSGWYKNWLKERIAYYARWAGFTHFLTKQDIACGSVDEYTGGICLRTMGHMPSCEIRWPGTNMPGTHAVNGR